jgi:hypothetical protein
MTTLIEYPSATTSRTMQLIANGSPTPDSHFKIITVTPPIGSDRKRQVGIDLRDSDAIDMARRILIELAPHLLRPSAVPPPEPKFSVGDYVRRKRGVWNDMLYDRVMRVTGTHVTQSGYSKHPSGKFRMLNFVEESGWGSAINQDLVEKVDVVVKEVWEVK